MEEENMEIMGFAIDYEYEGPGTRYLSCHTMANYTLLDDDDGYYRVNVEYDYEDDRDYENDFISKDDAAKYIKGYDRLIREHNSFDWDGKESDIYEMRNSIY